MEDSKLRHQFFPNWKCKLSRIDKIIFKKSKVGGLLTDLENHSQATIIERVWYYQKDTIYLYIVFLEKNQFWLLPHIMKIEMYLDLIVKTKIVIFLGGIISENPCNIRIGKCFLY